MSIQDLTEQSPPDLTEPEFTADMAQLAKSAPDSELCMAEALGEFARIADEIALIA